MISDGGQQAETSHAGKSLPPFTKPYPNTKTRLAQIQKLVNATLTGANTGAHAYRKLNSPAGLANTKTTLVGPLILKPASGSQF